MNLRLNRCRIDGETDVLNRDVPGRLHLPRHVIDLDLNEVHREARRTLLDGGGARPINGCVLRRHPHRLRGDVLQ